MPSLLERIEKCLVDETAGVEIIATSIIDRTFGAARLGPVMDAAIMIDIIASIMFSIEQIGEDPAAIATSFERLIKCRVEMIRRALPGNSVH